MSDLNKVLYILAEQRYPNDKEKAVQSWKRWAQEVRFQETNDQNITQHGGGPGKGYYQYEWKKSGSGSNITAINRSLKFYNDRKLEAPKWLQELKDKDVDFLTLSKDQQTLIFILDKNSHPGTKMVELVNAFGTEKWESVSRENWEKGHKVVPPFGKYRGKDAPWSEETLNYLNSLKAKK